MSPGRFLSSCGCFVAAQLASQVRAQPLQDSSPAAPGDGVAFLVVAPRGFHDALQEYLEHKRARMKVTLAALEEVLEQSDGRDDAEKLKRHLYESWKTRGARYVLLVGDADVLPVRYMVLDRVTEPAFHYAFYPSDLYYADVARSHGSFDDWNAQHDGFHAAYFGEVRGEKNKSDPINFDAVDYRPELAVGRWPVSTPEEVRIVAAKTSAYERSLASRGPDRRRAVFAVVGGWVDARGRFDAIAARLPKQWRVEKRYYADKPLRRTEQGDGAGSAVVASRPAGEDGGEVAASKPAPPPGLDEAEIVRLMNEGVGLILHAGHGEDHRWEHSLSVSSIKKLTNDDRLPIVLSAGCSTARFATLPPYEAYVDVDGVVHRGTNDGEVFTSPPPAPACYAEGKYNKTGLGEQAPARRAERGGGLFRLQHRQPALRPDAAGGVRRYAGEGLADRGHTAGRLLGRRGELLLREGAARDHPADGELVSGKHFLSGHEVHAVRRSDAADAVIEGCDPVTPSQVAGGHS